MKIFYWSPFISKIATISSTIRSAESILKYSKKENNINLAIIDAIGEWKNYKKIMTIFIFFHDKGQLQVLVAFKIVKMHIVYH